MKVKIGKRLRQIRERFGMSQTEFGNSLGIQYQHVSKYERGESVPTWENLIKLIQNYDININWLLTGEGDQLRERHQHEVIVSRNEGSGDDLFSLTAYLETDIELKNAITNFVLKYKNAKDAAEALVNRTEALKKLE